MLIEFKVISACVKGIISWLS